jgi:hypothetical protein
MGKIRHVYGIMKYGEESLGVKNKRYERITLY